MKSYMVSMPNQHDAYKEAEKFDALVNELLVEYPLANAKNDQFWLTFYRTAKSTIVLLEKAIRNA